MNNQEIHITAMAFKCRVDAALTFDCADGNSRQVTGYNEAELIETGLINLPDLIEPTYRDEVRKNIQEGISRRGTFAIKFPLFTKDKTPADGILIGKGIFEGPLNLTAIEGYILRLRSGESLIRTEQLDQIPPDLWQELLAQSDEIIAYIGSDTLIHYISPSVQRILGYEVHALQGIPFSDILLPEEKEYFTEYCNKARISENSEERTVFTVMNSDGNYLQIEIKLFSPGISDGSLILTGNEFHKQERKNLQDEDLLKAISNSSPVPLIITEGREHKIIAYNELFSHLIENTGFYLILGSSLLDTGIFVTKDVLQSRDFFSGTDQIYTGIEVSLQALTKTVPVLLSTRSIYDGNIERVFWSFVPLPEKKYEDKPFIQTTTRDNFNSIYQQCESDLSAIENLMKKRENFAEPNAERIIRENRAYLFACSSFYHNISESAQSDSVSVCAYLNTLISNFSELYSDSFERITLSIHCNGDWKVNSAIGTRLGIIVTELLLNSINHAFVSVDSGSIEISFTREEGWHILQIADNGTGFPEDIIQGKLERPGLSMIDNLASDLSGTATFTNEPGARVRIIFPHTDFDL